jgi:tetratricopeptide (TPR) repeat protein
MTQASGTTAMATAGSRAGLCDAIGVLERMGREPRVRLALAEAEFRIAIAPETEPAEAIERLRRAIFHDPFLPKLYLHLGRLLHRSGKHRAALSEYRQAVQLAPSSRRAHLLMALALLELDRPEQELGHALVRALSQDSAEELRTAVADLDALIDDQSSGEAHKGGPHSKRTRRRPRRPPPDGQAGDSARDKAGPTATDTWRVGLVEQLSRQKPDRTQIAKHLDTGSAQIHEGGGLAEYAAACVLMIASGDPPAEVRKLAKMAGVDRETDHPAVAMLDAVLNLAETNDLAVFVAAAAEHLQRRLLPPELVCWLHFSKDVAKAGQPVVESVRLLDSYPEEVRALDCFRELRIAVLDEHARRAWAGERFAEARLLWREAAALDPYRVPVAVNLALLAARTRSVEDYGPAWERLAEVLYLHAAGARDVQLFLEDRKALHLALSQQSLHRHCPQTSGPDKPSRNELANWIADANALEVWLLQWDLYYLNARLHFRSPLHLLGQPRDASTESLVEARDVLVSHVDSVLPKQSWAGLGVFCDLVRAHVNEAFQHALDPVNRVRDAYYELEKPQAEALADETLKRMLLLRRLMHTLLHQDSARRIRLGCSIARREFVLPLAALQQLCVDRGLIGHDDELYDIFETDLIGLASNWDRPEPTESDWSARLGALDECVRVLSHRLELRWLRCLLLYQAGWRREAYTSALEALDLPVPPKHAETAHDLRTKLIELIDHVGYLEIPEALRQPRDAASAEKTVAAARQALPLFPRSATLRALLANLLVQLGGEARMREAVEVLTDGIESALSDGQRLELETQLASTRSAAATEAVRKQVRDLVQPAMDRVQHAVDGLREAPGHPAVQATLEVVRQAISDVSRGLDAARVAELTDEERQLDDALSHLRRLERQLGNSEE